MNLSSKYELPEEQQHNLGQSLKENVVFYLRNIHWFLISVVLALTLAYIKLQYATPLYQSTAKVLFKGDDNSGLFNEASAFQDLGYGYSYSPIENEIETLKSRSLMKKVVQELKLNVVFYNNDNLVPEEQYGNCPLKITFLKGDSSIYGKGARYDIKILPNNQFLIENERDKYSYTGLFGKPFQSKLGEILLTPSGKSNPLVEGKKYILYVYELENSVDAYAGSIQIERANEFSNVLEISLIDNSIEKSKDIVNSIIHLHQTEAIADKNMMARNSINFINDRINIISKELSDVEGNVQQFKTSQNIVDVSSEAGLFMETQQEIEKDVVENQIQLKLAEYVNDYLKETKSANELLPSNLGLNEMSIVSSIETYNNLVLERNRILKNSNEKNPVALNLESKIINLQGNLRESLKKYESTLRLRGKQLDLQNKKIGNRINSVPKQEKMLREIQRQQQIKESLYLYLLQKREETAITLSLTVANSRVIDEAHSDGNVVSPNRKRVYLIGFIFGGLIPFLVLFLIKKLNNKIRGTEQIEKAGLPVICEIPQSKIKGIHPIISSNENTALVESFRLLRTNLDFLLGTKTGSNQVVMITSSLPEEGKSFISLNLAKSLGVLGKKVLVLGMDLRSPTLTKYLDIPNKIGVSNYIVNSDFSLNDICIKSVSGLEFDLIPSGDIPPNPADLLVHPRVQELVNEAKKEYDFILIDTPPLAIVSDTLLLSSYADLTLFVIRENFTEQKHLRSIKQLQTQNRLPMLQVVVNFSKENQTYGYDHLHRKKAWYKSFSTKRK